MSHIPRRMLIAFVLDLLLLSMNGPGALAQDSDAPESGQITANPIEATIVPVEMDALARLTADLCSRQIVLLGEERTHGSAATIEVKASLVRNLVDNCGFAAVLFESSIYDFLRYRQNVAGGQARIEQLSDAIGGLWVTSAEFDPLLEFLHQHAQTGQLVVGGIDVQAGSATALYTQRDLPGDLAAVLPAPDASRCETLFDRHNRWQYNAEHPFDADELAQLTECADQVRTQLSSLVDHSRQTDLEAMASSYARHFRMLDGDNSVRSAGMADNLLWHLDQLPANSRIVVWTASVHAIKAPLSTDSGAPRLGELLRERLGDAVVSIGFSALDGEYGRGGVGVALTPALEDSLEMLAFTAEEEDLAYLDAVQLREAGPRPSRVLDYAQWQTANWSSQLDGLVVVRTEHAQTPVRAASPRQ